MIKYLRKSYMYLRFKKRGLTKNPFLLTKNLEKSQFWDNDILEAYQLDSINRLINRSRKEIKFYQKEIYSNYSNIEKLDSFKNKFPYVTKDVIQENTSLLLSKKTRKTVKHMTSGSTAKPITVHISDLAESFRIASRMRNYQWWGIDLFDRNVLIWKIPDRKKGSYSFFKRNEIKSLGRLELDVFKLNHRTINGYYRKIETFKPKFIRGYKSGVLQLAKLMEEKKLTFKKTQLKVVIVTSEVLFDEERDFMERVFKCKIANEYGAADGGLYAFECPEGSMHVNEESVYISSDNDNIAYVTELFNYSMPLINYRNEDRVIFSEKKCSCGRNLKVINKIEGRTTDYILCKNGTKKNSLILGVIIKMISNKFKGSIKQFKVTQSGNNLYFDIIPGEEYNDNIVSFLKEKIAEQICTDLSVEIKLVQHIEREKSGKLRYFIRKF